MTKAIVNLFIVALVASIPSLIFAAWWFQDANLLLWIVIPFIIFMAG
jgi:hypothetical protein